MTALEDFKAFVADAEAGAQFKKWASDNPGEIARWRAYRDLVLAGQSAAAPAMTTPHGRELVDAAKLYLDAAPAPTPPVGYPTLDAYEMTLQPDNSETGTSSDRYSFGWTAWTSPRTPRPSLNGIDPPARILALGDHVYMLAWLKLIAGSPSRWFNFHNVAGDPGWTKPGVSAFAIDLGDGPGASGSRHEVTCEFERAQDVDTQPHSGGAHWPLGDDTVEYGRWRGFAIELTVGSAEDGMFAVYDWATGRKLAAAAGINTKLPGDRYGQLWVGGYINTGAGAPVVFRQTPVLFSTVSFKDALTDQPRLVSAWHSYKRQGGSAVDSTIALGVERVQVPASPLV